MNITYSIYIGIYIYLILYFIFTVLIYILFTGKDNQICNIECGFFFRICSVNWGNSVRGNSKH